MKTAVSALFDSRQLAEQAVQKLLAMGMKRQNISLLASTASGEYREFAPKQRHGQETLAEYEAGDRAAAGVGIGAGIGALAGLAWLAVPGFGPLLAAGDIALALGVGAITGGVAGGVIGAMTDAGIEEDEADYFAEGLRRGGSVVTVAVDTERAALVADVMRSSGAVDLNQRLEEWRDSGWRPMQETVSSTPPGVAAVPTPGSSKPSYVTGAQHGGTPIPANIVDDSARIAGEATYCEDEVREVYVYGQTLGFNGQGKSWDSVETEAAMEWERRHPGTWDKVKDAARSAYEQSSKQRSP